tara:strand:- start:2204 stop:2821 length:618 start_codon:yes stop_codon:yes gene_type:complete
MSLVNMICAHDIKVIINMNELTNADRLRGACVFNRLMGIHNPGFEQKMTPNEGDELTLFKDFNITEKDWMNFISFIRLGRIKYEIAANEIHNDKDRESYQKLFMQHLDDITNSGIFLKFGPFPVFEEYIEWTHNRQTNIKRNTKNQNANNPMIPKQDIKQLFCWCVEYTNNISERVENGNWSVTTVASGGNSYYLRRRRPLPEQD